MSRQTDTHDLRILRQNHWTRGLGRLLRDGWRVVRRGVEVFAAPIRYGHKDMRREYARATERERRALRTGGALLAVRFVLTALFVTFVSSKLLLLAAFNVVFTVLASVVLFVASLLASCPSPASLAPDRVTAAFDDDRI